MDRAGPPMDSGPLPNFSIYTWRNDYSIWLRQKTGTGWITWSLFWPAGDQHHRHHHQRLCYHICYLIVFQTDTSSPVLAFLFFMVFPMAVHPEIPPAEHL